MIPVLINVCIGLALSGAGTAFSKHQQAGEANAMGALSSPPPPRRGAPQIERQNVSGFWFTMFVLSAVVGSLLGIALASVIIDFLPTRPTFHIGGTF